MDVENNKHLKLCHYYNITLKKAVKLFGVNLLTTYMDN